MSPILALLGILIIFREVGTLIGGTPQAFYMIAATAVIFLAV